MARPAQPIPSSASCASRSPTTTARWSSAINKRLELVARLKAYKDSRGFDFVDTAREEWMLQDLLRANRGPLSADGLREIYAEVLALTKREVAPDEGA